LQRSTTDFEEEVKDRRLAAIGLTRAGVDELLGQRQAHREAKRWQDADRVRDELAAKGIQLMDGREGSRWRVRLGAD
jgi:cysteinyl-tRNA synthetase